jgi:transcriptional regulator with XRE-family HTH domain
MRPRRPRTRLNEILLAARERTGLPQRRFARIYAIGGVSTVERAETRLRPPSRATLYKYGRWEKRGPRGRPALGLSFDRLLDEAGKTKRRALPDHSAPVVAHVPSYEESPACSS